MRQADDFAINPDVPPEHAARRTRWLAVGGIGGALLASSCCIAPLLLATLGISGAWIGALTALEPYKPYVLAVTAALLGAGFWHVYIRPAKLCADGSYCARPMSGVITRTVLWLATLIAVLSATIDTWAPIFY